jgi:hypothetical protein
VTPDHESARATSSRTFPTQPIEHEQRLNNVHGCVVVQVFGCKNATAVVRQHGTHLCALPTGEYCPKRLICLACAHSQPKKSAVPIFGRMLTSHEPSLSTARGYSEPAGQIAAHETEIVRIKGALHRAEKLSDDVAAAFERAL